VARAAVRESVTVAGRAEWARVARAFTVSVRVLRSEHRNGISVEKSRYLLEIKSE
jgi:hypothetical protein